MDSIPPYRNVALAITRPALVGVVLLSAGAVLSLLAALFQISWWRAEAPIAFRSSALPALSYLFVAPLIFLALPAAGLHYLRRAALRGSRWALAGNLVFSSVIAAGIVVPLATVAVSSLVDYIQGPSDPAVNATARLLLVVILELLALAVVTLVARAWWRSFLGTYLLMRSWDTRA